MSGILARATILTEFAEKTVNMYTRLLKRANFAFHLYDGTTLVEHIRTARCSLLTHFSNLKNEYI